jgi:hypothetical protein
VGVEDDSLRRHIVERYASLHLPQPLSASSYLAAEVSVHLPRSSREQRWRGRSLACRLTRRHQEL